MADEKHVFPSAASKFCSTRVCSCGKKNDYQDCCKAVREEWKIVQGSRGRMFGLEAHHILCVESMNQRPKGESGEKLHQILMQTEWCINASINMIALPKFGHTLKWYSIRELSAPPSWKNHPHHDIHHNNTGGYRSQIGREIGNTMDMFIKNIENKNCELSTSAIAENLNALARKWRSVLRNRGSRQGGTHAAWNRAARDPTYREWILPFSMAADSVALTLTIDISFSNKHTKKFKQLVTAIGGK